MHHCGLLNKRHWIDQKRVEKQPSISSELLGTIASNETCKKILYLRNKKKKFLFSVLLMNTASCSEIILISNSGVGEKADFKVKCRDYSRAV